MRPRIERGTSSVGMRPLTVSCPNPVVGAGLEPNSEERALFLKPTLSRGNASPQQSGPMVPGACLFYPLLAATARKSDQPA